MRKSLLTITADPIILIEFQKKYGKGHVSSRLVEMMSIDLGNDIKKLSDNSIEKLKLDLENLKGEKIQMNEQERLLNNEIEYKELERENKIRLELEQKTKLKDFKDNLPAVCVFCKGLLGDVKTKLFTIDGIDFNSHKGCFLSNGEKLKETEKEIRIMLDDLKNNPEDVKDGSEDGNKKIAGKEEVQKT